MGEKSELMEKLLRLKLEKRDLILMGKNTRKIDEVIKEVEKELNKFCNN